MLCRHWLNGHCSHGDQCTFAHGEHELKDYGEEKDDYGEDQGYNPNNYKKDLCRHWLNGFCSHGDKCTYAHGEHELKSNA